MNIFLRSKSISLVAAILCLILVTSLAASARIQDPASPPVENQSEQGDPIRQLNLNSEQLLKIRAINAENREQRIRINSELREAQVALEQTLDADNPNEATVEQRIRDVANAQAAQIRMRALTELRIRGVLTPDQLRIWRQMRVRSQSLRRQLNNPEGGRREIRRGMQNQRNGLAPVFPRERRGADRARPRQ